VWIADGKRLCAETVSDATGMPVNMYPEARAEAEHESYRTKLMATLPGGTQEQAG
jgi:hypothetical protein